MRLDRKQKEIIKSILSGRVYSILTYIKEFELGQMVKYDKDSVEIAFENDSIPKRYYWNQGRNRGNTNILSKSEYELKCERYEINPDKYMSDELKLCFPCGIREVLWGGNTYSFNFYDGVYVANSFSDIMDFLSLCQYLKSEMLILEVPDEEYESTLSLFFEKKQNPSQESYIDYRNLTCADTKYLPDRYEFSEKNSVICSEYIKKRFYPSPRLNLYVKQGFNTPEEKAQKATLFAAWIAIIISLTSAALPYLIGNKQNYLRDVTDYVQEIRESVAHIVTEKDIKQLFSQNTTKLDELITEITEMHQVLLNNQGNVE